ncbi:MAG TPA: 30S ribosome-binding factor RbfA [Bacteroidota bacterium]|nr:30S ribosome-binding factor RbfA [Bacteroidota bacterium]
MTLRTDRVASLIREEIGSLLSQKYQASEYGLVTVTEVQVTPDLRIAKVYVSIMGNEERKKATLKRLEQDKKSIRSFLGSQIRIKFTPDIQFFLDDTMDRIDKINRIIDQIHSSDQGT